MAGLKFYNNAQTFSTTLNVPEPISDTTVTMPSSGTVGTLESPAFTGIPTAVTAVAGTNTTQLATTEFVKAKSELDSIGVNQTWQNMAASRAIGVTYTNTTGKPIVVTAFITSSDSVFKRLILQVNSLPVASTLASSTAGEPFGSVTGIVPSGANYSVVMAGSWSVSISFWSELR